MASALARGWGDPVLATDSGSGRAAALAAELGGEAVASNRELAERADVMILAHKPYQLAAVAEISSPSSTCRSSPTTQADVRVLYPSAQCSASSPVRSSCARACVRRARLEVDQALYAELREHSPPRAVSSARAADGRGGRAGRRPGVLGGAGRGLDRLRHPARLKPEIATLVVETMAGAALLREYGGDTLALRRSVASPEDDGARIACT